MVGQSKKAGKDSVTSCLPSVDIISPVKGACLPGVLAKSASGHEGLVHVQE